MLLKDLTLLNGVSGNEDEVRDFIKKALSDKKVEISIDPMGSLIAFKKGRDGIHKLMLSAHMDEVGFMVTGFNENGTIKFKNIGGIDERILPGKRVLVGDANLPGIIGVKPVHMQGPEERSSNIKLKNLYIDIGTDKKEEAEKLVSLGDYISFHSDYVEFGDECIKAKALDDRVGCAALIEMLDGDYSFDLYACFTVQEEVGLRGAAVAAYTVSPDMAIVVEGTTCSDVPGAKEHEYSTLLGGGAALTIVDRTSYPDKGLVEFIHDVAARNGLPIQFKQTATGGNDAGKIQYSKTGVKTASISVPCRYIHSPVSMMSKKDYIGLKKILKAVLDELSLKPEMFK